MNIRSLFSPAAIAIIALIISGGAQFIMGKVLNYQEAVGENGESHLFRKPVFQTILVFVAQIPVYFYWLLTLYLPQKKLIFPKRTFRDLCLSILPALTYIIGLVMSVVALYYISSSIDGMLACTQIVFTAVLTYFVLRQKIWLYQIVSVALAVSATIFISLASINGESNEDHPASKKVLGILLVLGANLSWSFQNILTEVALRVLHPLELTGLQGIVGTIFLFFICSPIVYYIPGDDPRSDGKTSYENILDTFKMLSNSTELTVLCVIQFFLQIAFNTSFTYVIDLTSSVNVCIILVVRTLFVWITLLIIDVFYTQPYTEKWSNWSFSQLFGYLLNVAASFLYNRVVEFKFFSYPDSKKVSGEDDLNEAEDDSKENKTNNEEEENRVNLP